MSCQFVYFLVSAPVPENKVTGSRDPIGLIRYYILIINAQQLYRS
jgi:hypothetical protein